MNQTWLATGFFIALLLLSGIPLFGAVGIVLGPVLFALLRALLDLYSEEYSTSD